MPTTPKRKYIRRIIKKTPENKIDEIGDELDEKLGVLNLADSRGGKILIEGLFADVISAIDAMAIGTTKLEHFALVALATRAGERLAILRAMLGAKSNVDVLQALLKEAILAEKDGQNGNSDTDPNHEAMIDPRQKEEAK